jgi:hypothetical protein
MLRQHGRTVTHFIEESVNVLFKGIGLIVKLVPLGVPGASRSRSASMASFH